MKLRTEVDTKQRRVGISKSDKVLMLGSCFASNIGEMMLSEGYDVCINPFGTLFNPSSIASSMKRLAEPRPFEEKECVMMGSGSNLWGSFSHYTRFARPTKEEFLQNANESLEKASAFYRDCGKIIITFGTAWVFDYVGDETHPMFGKTVSNCLKRPSKDFCRHMLDVEAIASIWKGLVPSDKEVIFTVSPIRHMADGAHGNALSKSTLLLATEIIVNQCLERGVNAEYFPSYEILLDELRDYSWYAEDLVHPSQEAINIIKSRFLL